MLSEVAGGYFSYLGPDLNGANIIFEVKERFGVNETYFYILKAHKS